MVKLYIVGAVQAIWKYTQIFIEIRDIISITFIRKVKRWKVKTNIN